MRDLKIDETVEILNVVMPRYEEFHGVRYTSFAVDAAAALCQLEWSVQQRAEELRRGMALLVEAKSCLTEVLP